VGLPQRAPLRIIASRSLSLSLQIQLVLLLLLPMQVHLLRLPLLEGLVPRRILRLGLELNPP
jgi:hypothetical protein